MAVVGTGTTSGSSTTTGTVYNTASVTPTANTLQLLAVYSRFSVTDTTISSVTGNGLTWVEATSETPTGASDRTMRLFRALGASPSAGAITITYAHNQQTYVVWTLTEFSGVDTTGTNGSGALRNPTGGEQATGSNINITLPAFASANNGTYGSFAIIKATTSTPGAGFSELYDFQTGLSTMTTEWRNDNSTSVGVAWASNTSTQFGIAAEIVAASAPKSLVVPRRSSTLIRT